GRSHPTIGSRRSHHDKTPLRANNVCHLHAISGDLCAMRAAVASLSRSEGPRLAACDLSKFHPADDRELHLWSDRKRPVRLDRGDHFRVLLQSLARLCGCAVQPESRGAVELSATQRGGSIRERSSKPSSGPGRRGGVPDSSSATPGLPQPKAAGGPGPGGNFKV